MDWIQWIFSVIGVLGLIFLLFYALKKLNKRVSVSSGDKLKVLDRVGLGRDGMLLVVSVCGKLMLVGATSQRIEKLCDLEGTEEDYLNGKKDSDFMSVFSAMMGRKAQNEQGESPDEGASEKSDTTE